ncbi:MAG: redoxin domain-containing protein [Microbacteriaceae bacterium]|nr:redoxin domain-containing protein [Microbacteriaceae bacterium]
MGQKFRFSVLGVGLRKVCGRGFAVLVAVGLLVGIAGCSGNDPLAQQLGNNSRDRAAVSVPAAERKAAVDFRGTDEHGRVIAAADFRGKVTVINFWYAACAPCRAEIGDLVAAAAEHAEVKFLGVNTRDQKEQAQQFATEFRVPYPSILDLAGGRSVQAAFAESVPLNAVPTTLILDKQGRVAHRILGQIAGKSQLDTLIKETLTER